MAEGTFYTGPTNGSSYTWWTTLSQNDTHSTNRTVYGTMTTTVTTLTAADQAGQAFKAILMTTIILATVLGNLIVISAFIKFRSLKTMNNCFIVSLAVADLLVGKLRIPYCYHKVLLK